MKRTAVVFLASLIVVFYAMYMRINAAGAEETTVPIESTASETLPPSVSDPAETTKIVDIPKPVQTTETVTDTVPETTETAPVTEETTAAIVVTETETAPAPAETAEVTSETAGPETEPERETVPPPETIEQETRAPKMVLHASMDKVLAQVTVAINPPDTVKPVAPAVTAAQAITTVGKTESVSETTAEDTAAAAETSAAADMTVLSAAPVTSSNEDVSADSPHLTAGSVVVIGAGAAAITALLYFYRFARRP